MYVLGTQKNRLNKIFFENPKYMFKLMGKNTGLQIRVNTEKLFFLFLNQNMLWVLKLQKNLLNETVLLSTQNICLN